MAKRKASGDSSGHTQKKKKEVESLVDKAEDNASTSERAQKKRKERELSVDNAEDVASISSVKGKEKATTVDKDVTADTVTVAPIIYPSRKKTSSENELEDTFAKIVKQAKDTDNELLNVMNETSIIINLPKLGPNNPQECFQFLNEKLPFIRRKHHSKISKTFVNALNEGNRSRGLYIFGPSGLGKSYSLYYLVSELRVQRNNYRVTYIDSCKEWWISHKLEPYQYLLNELLCTFNDDELLPLTKNDWAELVMNGLTTKIRNKLDSTLNPEYAEKINKINNYFSQSGTNASISKRRKERFTLFLNELVEFVNTKSLYWVWVFDQHNALCEYESLNKYPFVLVKALPGILNDSGLVIVSESLDNNDLSSERFKSWKMLPLLGGYDDEEFNQWRILHKYNDQLKTVKFWTDAYPLELDLWRRTPESNLQAKTEKYLKEREADIVNDHQKFRENLSNDRIINLNDHVTSMILQTTLTTNLKYGLNRQFMQTGIVSFQNENEKNSKVRTIIATNPLTRLAIIHAHGQETLKDNKVSRVLRSEEYDDYGKERVAGLYITTMLDIRRVFEFTCWKPNRASSVFDVNIVIDKVVRFVGNDTPCKSSFKEYQSVLFIPETYSYPGADFLVWSSQDTALFAFQISISDLKNCRKNANSFTKGALKEKWASLCGIEESGVHFIWIVPDDCASNVKKPHLYTSVSNIETQFPALATFR